MRGGFTPGVCGGVRGVPVPVPAAVPDTKMAAVPDTMAVIAVH